MRILNLLPLGEQGGIEQLCLEVARLSADENHFYFMWGGGIVADKIRKYTQNVVVRNFSYSKIISEYKIFLKYIIDNEIELILVQVPSPVFLLYTYIVKHQIPNIKLCAYIHSDPIDVFTTKIKAVQFKMLHSKFDGCIAISKYVAQEMYNMFAIKDAFVVYNGTDTEKFSVNNRSYDGEPIRLIYVGRLIHEKGVDILLKSLTSINNKFVLNIIGDGPCRAELEELSEILGLSNKVNFLGARYNISEWLQQSDLFIHPARWQEGFGITLIESMAAGVPCVAFRRGAVPEIITDGDDGFLVDDFSDTGLSNGIRNAISIFESNVEKFEKISKAAVNRAKNFDINIYVDELSRYLHSI